MKHRPTDEYDNGLGTSRDMWEFLSELLEGEKLPDPLNEALYALRDGRAFVALKEPLSNAAVLSVWRWGIEVRWFESGHTARSFKEALREEEQSFWTVSIPRRLLGPVRLVGRVHPRLRVSGAWSGSEPVQAGH